MADLLIVNEDSPLGEKKRPVAILGANEGQRGSASVGHVGADVEKIFEKPETTECDGGRFSLPPEICCAEQRNDKFAESPAEDHDRMAEPTEEKVAAFMDDQIYVVND